MVIDRIRWYNFEYGAYNSERNNIRIEFSRFMFGNSFCVEDTKNQTGKN